MPHWARKKGAKAPSKIASSLVLALLSLALLVALWSVDGCPHVLERVGIPCDLVVGVAFFAVHPALAVLGMVFGSRDLVRGERRFQAMTALGLCAAILLWHWKFSATVNAGDATLGEWTALALDVGR